MNQYNFRGLAGSVNYGNNFAPWNVRQIPYLESLPSDGEIMEHWETFKTSLQQEKYNYWFYVVVIYKKKF